MAKKVTKAKSCEVPQRPRGPRRRQRRSRQRAKRAKQTKKYVYFFGNGKADGDRSMQDTLGGKGAGLAEMTNAGLPVPPGSRSPPTPATSITSSDRS